MAAASGVALCPQCAKRMSAGRGGRGPLGVAGSGGLERVSWAFAYDGVARELIAALKFGGRVGLAEIAAAAIAGCIAAADGVAVVPVPASPLRRRRRGFDPAELIAKRLAAALGLELVPCLARRNARRQVGRGRAERLATPPSVRAVATPPERALLIDDVLTTGATLAACADALRGAGSLEVEAAVFARALGQRAAGA